jgi:hypothetical protein
MVKKLSWDLKTNFLYFKEYWSNEDILYDFLVDNLQGLIQYPPTLNNFNLDDDDDEYEQTMEFFTNTVYDMMDIIKYCIDYTRSLSDFRNECKKQVREKLSHALKGGDIHVGFLINKLVEEFVEKG